VDLPAGTYQVMAMYAGGILTTDAVATGTSVTVDFTVPSISIGAIGKLERKYQS